MHKNLSKINYALLGVIASIINFINYFSSYSVIISCSNNF